MAERDLLVRIIGDEKDLLRAYRSSERGTRQFQGQMTGVSRSVRNVFAAAGVALGATAIVQAFRSTISAAIDFESSFAGVRKTVDATEPQLQALATGFRNLSKEIPVSVDELNKIGEAAGQLGIQRTAILDFTETIAAIGVSTNLASDQAADAFARLANITQIPQDQFDNLGSTVVELGNKLAATESEITDFGLRIAAAGKIVGLTVDETLAIAGAFTSVGVEAEAGGTAVSKVFISLANAVETGGKQLQAFADTAGTSIGEFRRLFEADTAGAFSAFVEGLKRVDAEGGNVFKTLNDLGLSDVRLIRAFLSISQSGDLLSRSLAIGSRAWDENSALQEEAAKRYETTASKLQIFQNRVNDLQITLGNVLAPALLEIITPLGKWLESTENQERVQRALIQTMEDARAIFEGVRSVVQPLAEGVKSLADRMGGLNQAVKLLLISMVAAKVVNFGSAITGLGTAAAGTTTRVKLLQGALLRLGAIGVITLSIEFLTNYDEIQAQFTRLVGLQPDPLPKDAEKRLEVLQDKLARTSRFFGQNEEAVKKLRAQIAALNKELGINQPAAALHEERPTTVTRADKRAAAAVAARATELRDTEDKERAALREAARLRREDAAEEAAAIEAAARVRTVAARKALEAARRDTALRIAAEKRDQEMLRLSRQRTARISSQFEALGLTGEGQQRAPGVGALRGRLADLREQLKGTALDTDKTRSQLRRIAQVLKGEFGAVGRDVRLAILGMFNDIAGGFKEGQKQTEATSGNLTAHRITDPRKILGGADLSSEQFQLLYSRLISQSSGGGFRTTPGQGAFGFSTFGAGQLASAGFGGGLGGAMIFTGPITVVSDDPEEMGRKLGKKGRRAIKSRGGRFAGNRGL